MVLDGEEKDGKGGREEFSTATFSYE